MSPERQDEKPGSWQRAVRDSAPYLGIGSSLAFTVLLCLWLGHWLDRRFGTEPWFFLIGAVLGVAGAFVHFWRMYKTMTGGRK